MVAPYFKIESFSANDGPGIRMVIFLTGCPYRCIYCHNPECWAKNNKKTISVEKIINDFMKNKKFYMNGGITLSGGEPLVHYDFCANIAKKCYENNINLAIDTCGYHKKLSDYDIFVKYNVLFLIDIKHTIEKFHKIITSKSSVLELKLINYLENKKTKYWIRFVYVKGYTDQFENISNIKEIIKNLKYLIRFDVLPLHLFASDKYESLGYKYQITKDNVPTKEEVKNLVNNLKIKP